MLRCRCLRHLPCLVSLEIPGSVGEGLTLIQGASQSSLFRIFLLSLAALLLLLVFPLHICSTFGNSPTVLGCSLLPLLFSLGGLYWDIPWFRGLLSHAQSPRKSVKGTLHFVTVVLITSLSFWFFLRFLSFCLHCPPVPAQGLS